MEYPRAGYHGIIDQKSPSTHGEAWLPLSFPRVIEFDCLTVYKSDIDNERTTKMPAPQEWSPAFSVGNPILDEQHRKLLAICKGLVLCGELRGAERVSRFHELLDEIARFAREHFKTEENILANVGYSDLEEQKREHLEFEERFTEILCDASTGTIDIPEISRFVSDWWLNHIQIADMRYKESLSRLP